MNVAVGFILIATAVATTSVASLDSLLEEAVAAGKQRNLAGWSSLYCKPQKASETDAHMIANFTRAYLEEPTLVEHKGVVKQLHMCMESTAQKETCVVVPVFQQDSRFCLGPGT